MNLGEIREKVRGYLNEPLPAFWTDAELKGHINTGMRKVHNRIKTVSRYHFTTRATFSTVAGTEYYSLPADCKDLKLVTWIDTDGRETPLGRAPWPDPTAFTPPGLLDPSVGSGFDGPTFYWIVGASIRLLPRPAAVSTIKLYYEARITDLSGDADLPSCDADYHDMIAKWAALEAGVKDNKPQEVLIGLYRSREDDMLQDVLHRVPANAQETESYIDS